MGISENNGGTRGLNVQISTGSGDEWWYNYVSANQFGMYYKDDLGASANSFSGTANAHTQENFILMQYSGDTGNCNDFEIYQNGVKTVNTCGGGTMTDDFTSPTTVPNAGGFTSHTTRGFYGTIGEMQWILSEWTDDKMLAVSINYWTPDTFYSVGSQTTQGGFVAKQGITFSLDVPTS